MQDIKDYLIAVTVAIIISEMLLSLLPEGGVKRFVRFAAGILLIVMILNPIKGCTMPELSNRSVDSKKSYSEIIWDVYSEGIENKNDSTVP